ncbi:MAG: D-glycerate 2-kinase [Anaerolineales bacterium]|nr:D-glycerate 2-kinase [Anaerolineales bacterium]
MDANRFATHSLNDPRILRILSAALNAVDPYIAVKSHLPSVAGDVYGLAVGKAAVPMMTALAESIPLAGALVISKHASSASTAVFVSAIASLRPPLSAEMSQFPLLLSGHPIPDARSVHAGECALEFVSSLKEEDTLICLISGGGSALMTAPVIPLEELQTLTAVLLASGATINEINTIRRHLDRVKGGGLARATKANIISLILSDVIGNPLEAIASGPTAPDPTTREDARAILEKYALIQPTILQFSNSLFETNKPNRPTFSRAQNLIIGDNKLAAQAALEQAQREGFDSEILTNELQGEAREVGVMLATKLRDEATKRRRPFCLIAGGETTVTIRGNGKGGRNQELALAAVNELRDLSNVMLIAVATDGEDGPTDAAGAVATGESAERAKRLGLSEADSLSRNDAFPFFESLGDLIRTHPTGTNVNDLVFLFWAGG